MPVPVGSLEFQPDPIVGVVLGVFLLTALIVGTIWADRIEKRWPR